MCAIQSVLPISVHKNENNLCEIKNTQKNPSIDILMELKNCSIETDQYQIMGNGMEIYENSRRNTLNPLKI